MAFSAPGGGQAGGPSQLSANSGGGSKIGGEEGGKSERVPESLYGNVNIPRMSGDARPRTSKNLEALRKRVKNDVISGIGGVTFAVIVSASLFFMAFMSFQGKVFFLTIPDFKEFAKKI